MRIGTDSCTDAPSTPAIRQAAAGWIARRDAGLSDGEEREFEAWRAADVRHRAEFARLEAAWRALDRPLRSGAVDAVLGELGLRAKRRRRRRLAFAGSVAVALVAMALNWGGLQPERDAVAGPTAVAGTEPTVRALPDGSVVESQDAAQLSVAFEPQVRRVVLHHGEAHFEVAKDTSRPFVVVAGPLQVRAVGTGFFVDVLPQAVEVTVTSGRVAVELAPADSRADAGRQLAVLDGGQGAVIDLPAARDDPPKVTPLALAGIPGRLVARDPRLEFSGTPLGAAVALMNRYNELQFTIEDPELATVRVSGVFGARNTSAFIQALESSFDVKVERRGENEMVFRRAH